VHTVPLLGRGTLVQVVCDYCHFSVTVIGLMHVNGCKDVVVPTNIFIY